MRPRGADSAAKLYIHEIKEAADLGPNETHKLHEESSFFSSHNENDCTDYHAARAWKNLFFLIRKKLILQFSKFYKTKQPTPHKFVHACCHKF